METTYRYIAAVYRVVTVECSGEGGGCREAVGGDNRAELNKHRVLILFK